MAWEVSGGRGRSPKGERCGSEAGLHPLGNLARSETEMLGQRGVGGRGAKALHPDHQAAATHETPKRFASPGFDRHDRRAIVGNDRVLVLVRLFEKEPDTGH